MHRAARAAGFCRRLASRRVAFHGRARSAGSDRLCGSTCGVAGRACFCAHRARSLSAASANSLTPSLVQFVGDLFIEMPTLARVGHGLARGLDIFRQAVARLAVIAEGFERRRRHGIDGVGPDQLLDVEHVAIGRILWCWCWPTARAASARPWPPASSSAGRRTCACSADRRVCRWRWRPCRAGPAAAPSRPRRSRS